MSTDESVRPEVPGDTADAPQDDPAPGRRRPGRRKRSRAETPGVALDKAPEVAYAAPPDDGDGSDAATDPRFWHRDHPVFTPLAGFFTGVLTVIVVLGLLGAILDLVVGYDVSEHPWVFLLALGVLLVINLVLVFVGSTRRFARYMLFGIVTTPVVVAGAAAITFYLLIGR